MSRGWLVALAGISGLVVLLGAILLLPFDWENERIQQATIAALVVAVGWFAGFVLRELSQQLARAERLRDVHRALFAEIRHNLEKSGLGRDAAGLRDGDAGPDSGRGRVRSLHPPGAQ